MNKLVSAALAAAVILSSSATLGAGTRAGDGIAGLLMPNGTFKPFSAPAATVSRPPSAFIGTINATITVSIGAPLPAGTTIHCQLAAEVIGIDAAGITDANFETDQVTATGSGTIVTCQNTIPYRWALFANSGTPTLQDSVTVTYEITAINPVGDGRTSAGVVAAMPVPASGHITNFTVSARI